MSSEVTAEPSSEGRRLELYRFLHAAGMQVSRKLTLGLRRYFQVPNSENKGSGLLWFSVDEGRDFWLFCCC